MLGFPGTHAIAARPVELTKLVGLCWMYSLRLIEYSTQYDGGVINHVCRNSVSVDCSLFSPYYHAKDHDALLTTLKHGNDVPNAEDNDFQGPHSYRVRTCIESHISLSVCLSLTQFLLAAKSHGTSFWVSDSLDTNLILDNIKIVMEYTNCKD